MMKNLITNLCIASTIFVGVSVLHSKPAHAWADFCNDTGEKIWVSFGAPNDSGEWRSFGWHEIRDNSCNRFYPHDLRARGVGRLYYFVQNAKGRNITPQENSGAFCVNYRNGFSYTSNEVKDFCGQNGTRWDNFAGFNIGNVRNMTFTLR
jgi:uncharacterized membrane protein